MNGPDEWTDRDNRQLGRLLHAARLPAIRGASLSRTCGAGRGGGLDKSVMRDLPVDPGRSTT